MFFQLCCFVMAGKLAAALSAIAAESAGDEHGATMSRSADGGRGLRSYLLSQYKSGAFTAKDICVLSWHCVQAGADGVSDLALDPNASSGNFAKHIKKALHVRAESTFFTAKIPMWDHGTQTRYLCDFPFNLPHDIFMAEFEKKPATFDINNYDLANLPPQFYDHEVVKEFGPKVVPLGYFSDGVPFTKTDSFISYYLSNINTGERFLICSVRKSDLCQCSCHGNCTFGSVMQVISWSFNVLATGVHPDFDYRGQPFSDEVRAARRGFPLAGGYRGALCEMRADLLEFVTAGGFKNWSNLRNPCFCCGTSRDDLFKFPKTMRESIWQPRDKHAYQMMITNSIVKRRIADKRALKLLLRNLRFDEEAGGLAIAEDMVGLRKGFRLLEAGPVSDVHRLADIETPADLYFFDRNSGVGLNHIFHLFDVKGFSIDLLHLDVMHIVDLGVAQYLAGEVLSKLVVANFCRSKKRKANMRHLDNMVELRRCPGMEINVRVRVVDGNACQSNPSALERFRGPLRRHLGPHVLVNSNILLLAPEIQCCA